MLVATEYEILRGVKANCLAKVELAREPRRIATLLNEEMFNALKGELRHNENVFLEDRWHDWDWHNGSLRFYSHAVGVDMLADVVVIYEVSN